MTDPTSSNPEPLLVMHGVRKRFGGVQALRGVSLEVAAGEVHALVGENGAGKSTLMKVLSGVETPDAGEMILSGRSWRPAGPVDARRGGIAMIHQELALAPHLSVAENIALGVEVPRVRGLGRLAPLDRRAMLATARDVLGRLGHGDLDPTRRTGDLPAAVRQLVEIGRALATDASVVVMDEPTSSLGRRDADRLLEIVGRLRGEGIAIVYISHFLEEIRRVADRFTVIRDGSTVTTGRMAETPDERLVEHMIGRPLDAVFPSGGRHAGEVRLEARSIAGHALPVEASMEVRSGEILGIAGLVGAGRTEFLRCLAGLDPTLRGDVSIHGGGIRRSTSIRGRMKAGLGFLSEDRKGEGLALTMSVGENLLLPRLGSVSTGGVLSPQRMDSTAGRWLARLAVRVGGPGIPAQTLSGGNQQKVAIARLLHQDADVLLLDEPTRGIDIGSKVQVYALLDELARAGRAIVMTSGHLPELLGVCDRIAVMHRGVLGPARGVDDCTESSLMREAVLGPAGSSEGEAA